MGKLLKFIITAALFIAIFLVSFAFYQLKAQVNALTSVLLWGSIVFITFSIAFLLSSRKKNKAQFQSQLEQYKNTGNLFRDFSDHLQSVREEERTSIAREVHDVLGQQLTVMKMDVSWMKKKLENQSDEVKEKTENVLEQINNTINTVRKIASDLRPGILDDLGLVAALEWQCKDFQEKFKIECNFLSNVEEIECDTSISTGVFRIFQEAFTNILRHAKASIITVALNKTDTHLQLHIQDNGVGISESKLNENSLGLMGIRERTRIMHGNISITGSAGEGTLVAVDIPLKG
jgi:signal transduction histidine kinase